MRRRVALMFLASTLIATLPAATATKVMAATTVAVASTCGVNSASPTAVSPGSTESFTSTVTANQYVPNAMVSFEIYNAAGSKVYQTFRSPVILPAGAGQSVSATWLVPLGETAGVYSVKILVFGPNWTPLYTYHYACTSFTVNRSAASTVTTAPSSANPSGQAMPTGDVPGWHQIFADDFTTPVPLGSFPGAVYGSKWTVYPDGWKDTSKNGTYYPSKVLSVSNGILNMHIHTENGVHMVAAPMPALPGAPSGGQLYGRYTIRFRADAIPGYKAAWLLWPDSNVWPHDGEIDFPEGNLTGTMGAYMHHMGATLGTDQEWYPTNLPYTSWHTATVEWSPNKCTFILDGQTVGVSTNQVPSTSMHWVLQTETQLSGGAPSDTAAGNVQIDWVAIYAPAR